MKCRRRNLVALVLDWMRSHGPDGAVDDLDRCYEAVAAIRDCDDGLSFAIFVKHLAQRRNVPREVVLFNDGVLPDEFEKSIFVEQFTAVLDEREQHVERLRPQRDRLSRPA